MSGGSYRYCSVFVRQTVISMDEAALIRMCDRLVPWLLLDIWGQNRLPACKDAVLQMRIGQKTFEALELFENVEVSPRCKYLR